LPSTYPPIRMIVESVAGFQHSGRGERLARGQRNEGGGHEVNRYGRHARGWYLPRNRRCDAWGTAGVDRGGSHQGWRGYSRAFFHLFRYSVFKELTRKGFPFIVRDEAWARSIRPRPPKSRRSKQTLT